MFGLKHVGLGKSTPRGRAPSLGHGRVVVSRRQWRILYSIGLPSVVCDFFEVTSKSGKGSGESLNHLPVGPREPTEATELWRVSSSARARMSFTVQVGPVLAARLNSMSCSYWSSQASSRKALELPRTVLMLQ